jgi:hypothetical protein
LPKNITKTLFANFFAGWKDIDITKSEEEQDHTFPLAATILEFLFLFLMMSFEVFVEGAINENVGSKRGNLYGCVHHHAAGEGEYEAMLSPSRLLRTRCGCKCSY